MSVDTRDRRAAVAGFNQIIIPAFPGPDGDLTSQADRQQMARVYPGLLSVLLLPASPEVEIEVDATRRRDFVLGRLRVIEELAIEGGLVSGTFWVPGLQHVEFVEWQFLDSDDAGLNITASLTHGSGDSTANTVITFVVYPANPTGEVIVRAWGY